MSALPTALGTRDKGQLPIATRYPHGKWWYPPYPLLESRQRSENNCLHPATNTAIFWMASLANSYHAFVADCSTLFGYLAPIQEHVDVISGNNDDVIATESFMSAPTSIMVMRGKLYSYKQTHQTLMYSTLLPQPNWQPYRNLLPVFDLLLLTQFHRMMPMMRQILLQVKTLPSLCALTLF